MIDSNDVRRRDAMNLWSRGIDWCVFKIGRQWRCADCFGFPVLFKTKKAAYEAATAMVLETARRNAEHRSEAS
jgi:hypothetical protein